MLQAVLLVRHARPVLDPSTHRSQWPLHADGLEAARALGTALRDRLEGRPIACSTERKAMETAAALASDAVEVAPLPGLCEVRSPWYDRREDHERSALDYLAGADLDGWEPAADAVRRFSLALAAVEAPEIVAVTHGTVMSAWAGTVVDGLDGGAFWSGLTMPDAWHVDLRAASITRMT